MENDTGIDVGLGHDTGTGTGLEIDTRTGTGWGRYRDWNCDGARRLIGLVEKIMIGCLNMDWGGVGRYKYWDWIK